MVSCTALLLAAARRRGRLPEALAGGTLALASSFLWVSHGAAAPLVLACLLLAARLDPERPPGEVWAGLLAGAAVWLRPDAAVGTGLLGLLLWRERRRLPWRYGLAAGAVIAAGLLAALAAFGSALPQTGVAKHAMAAAAAGREAGAGFWPAAFPLLARHWGPRWAWIAALGLAGLPALAAGAGRAGRLLALYAAALAVLYPLLGVPFFIWYAFPVAFAALYAAPFGAGWVGRQVAARLESMRAEASSAPTKKPRSGSEPLDPESPFPCHPERERRTWGKGWRAGESISRRPPPRSFALAQDDQSLLARAGARWVGAALALLLLLPAAGSLLPASAGWFGAYHWFPYLATYRRAALFVHRRSAPADAVAYVEIGVIGYYGRQPLVDLLGLVTPGSIPYVEQGDLVGAFLARPTTWVLFHTRGRMRPLVTRPWFLRAYEAAARFADSDGRGAMTVFRRRPGAPLPPAGPPGAAHDLHDLHDLRDLRDLRDLNTAAKRIDSRLPGPPPGREP